MKNRSYFYRFFHHFYTISKHRLIVCILCFKLGLYKQGLIHDLSKYSLVEFSSGVKYYQGDCSPIRIEKQIKGYSLGWLHHKGRNKHHMEYWADRNKNGYYPIEMPIKYVLEMLCDRISACKVYFGNQYSDDCAYNYFISNHDPIDLNNNTSKLLDSLLLEVKEKGLNIAFKDIKKRFNEKKIH